MADSPPSTSSPSPEPDERPDSSKSGVHLNAHGDVTVGGDIAGRDIIKTVTNFSLGGSDEARNRRNQLILLEKVKNFWIKGVLENPVYGEALIELSLETKLDAVERPWDMVLEVPEKESRILPPGKPIVEVFDEMSRALLILGAPGSGKTTTLLELARNLIARAERNPTEPIPVVFNLSSWAEHRRPLMDWLTEELSSKYQIPRKIGRAWLEAHDLLPLLDGLDEVHDEYREECVRAINLYTQEHGLTGLAVCCRAQDYSELTTKLKLSGAIQVLPFTEAQVDQWLATVGDTLAGLQGALKTDPALQELANSPLMLNVMSIACEAMPLESFSAAQPGSIESHRRHIFDAYVRRMFERVPPTRNGSYPSGQAIRWLAWLANRMRQQSQSVFLIENLRPGWLATRAQRWSYAFLSAFLPSLLLGFGLGLLFSDPVLNSETYNRLILGIVSGALGGIVVGLINIVQFEISPPSPQPKAVFTAFLLRAAIIWIGIGSLIAALRFSYEFSHPQFVDQPRFASAFAIILGGFHGMITGTVFALVFGLRRSDWGLYRNIQIVEALNWSRVTARKGAWIGTRLGFLVGLLHGVVLAMAIYLFWATTLLTSVVDILIFILIGGLSWGIALAVLGTLLGSIVGGLQGTAIPARVVPHNGIRRSAANAAMVGLIFWLGGATVIGLLAGLSLLFVSTPAANSAFSFFGMDFTLDRIFVAALSPVLIAIASGMMSGLTPGFIGGLNYGGLAVIQHFTLRLFLSLDKRIPWNFAHFLDYSADRIFLHKVGGGYIFIHRLLQEYFAGLDPDSKAANSI